MRNVHDAQSKMSKWARARRKISQWERHWTIRAFKAEKKTGAKLGKEFEQEEHNRIEEEFDTSLPLNFGSVNMCKRSQMSDTAQK